MADQGRTLPHERYAPPQRSGRSRRAFSGSGHTRQELQQRAREHGIPYYYRMTKDELEAELRDQRPE